MGIREIRFNCVIIDNPTEKKKKNMAVYSRRRDYKTRNTMKRESFDFFAKQR